MLTSVLFYVFAFILVFSAISVVTAKNPVHAVLFLVLAFVTSSCLWLMLNVEFLALILIVVYVGAVMVLFLFVVMMLDIDVETMRKGFWKNLPLAIMLGIIVLVEMLVVLINKPMVINNIPDLANSSISNANQLGWVLYTQYSYPVELASLILLLGLVAAVALTLRKSEKNAKYQNISKQVAAKASERFEMLNMPSEREIIEEDPQEGDKK
ncbi:MAG: NADH-quinone oxidoreductase subunit J [Proteobacteria bacterium]|jgi:NADH-quinone oxidoreductase subunit J|nr:NADH-quinone oxidoreductase subunit J [Pseudomonadota bacterium]